MGNIFNCCKSKPKVPAVKADGNETNCCFPKKCVSSCCASANDAFLCCVRIDKSVLKDLTSASTSTSVS